MKKSIIIKLIFNSFILISAILTIFGGIFQVMWDLQESEFSEPFSIVWNYNMFSYPYSSRLGLPVYIVLSIFFLQGVFTQFILYRNFDRSIIYYFSLILMAIGLYGCLFIARAYYLLRGDLYLVDYYWESHSTQILHGFYWGILSISLILIKKITIKNLLSIIRRKEIKKELISKK